MKPSDRVPSRRLWLSAGGGQQRGGGRQRGGRQRQQQEEWQEGGEEGGEYQERGRGRRRYKVRRGGGRPAGWQHDDRGEEAQGGEGEGGGQEWGDLDAVIQQQRQAGGIAGGAGGGRRQRRPRNKRQRRDVDMEDAEGGGMQVCVGVACCMLHCFWVGQGMPQEANAAGRLERPAQARPSLTSYQPFPIPTMPLLPCQDDGSEPRRFRRDEDDEPAAAPAAPAALAGPPREQVDYTDL